MPPKYAMINGGHVGPAPHSSSPTIDETIFTVKALYPTGIEFTAQEVVTWARAWNLYTHMALRGIDSTRVHPIGWRNGSEHANKDLRSPKYLVPLLWHIHHPGFPELFGCDQCEELEGPFRVCKQPGESPYNHACMNCAWENDHFDCSEFRGSNQFEEAYGRHNNPVHLGPAPYQNMTLEMCLPDANWRAPADPWGHIAQGL